MESSEHIWANISETICLKLLIFGEQASWTLFFQNSLTNPIISQISFSMTSHFGTLYGPVFHGLGHLIFKDYFKDLVGIINWFQWMNQYLWMGRRQRREKSNIIHLQSVALAFTSRVSNKRYQQEFAKRGGEGRLGQINIQRGTQTEIDGRTDGGGPNIGNGSVIRNSTYTVD